MKANKRIYSFLIFIALWLTSIITFYLLYTVVTLILENETSLTVGNTNWGITLKYIWLVFIITLGLEIIFLILKPAFGWYFIFLQLIAIIIILFPSFNTMPFSSLFLLLVSFASSLVPIYLKKLIDKKFISHIT